MLDMSSLSCYLSILLRIKPDEQLFNLAIDEKLQYGVVKTV